MASNPMKGQRAGGSESNTYDQGKGANAKTSTTSSSNGAPPKLGGNPRKGGGINRATQDPR